jgi:hypothetical protein
MQKIKFLIAHYLVRFSYYIVRFASLIIENEPEAQNHLIGMPPMVLIFRNEKDAYNAAKAANAYWDSIKNKEVIFK